MVVEPINEEVISLLKYAPFKNKELIVNEKQLGCNLSTLKALRLSCEMSDFFLYVEDDIILAKDSIDYLDLVKDKAVYHSLYQRHWTKNNIEEAKSVSSYSFDYRSVFISWGWAAKSDFVLNILNNSKSCTSECAFCQTEFMNLMTPPENEYHPHYDFLNIPDNLKEEIKSGRYHQTWDIHFKNYLKQIDWNGTCPIISRSNNIGAIGGVNTNNEEEHRNNQAVEYWRENWPHKLQ
jgi:hypothetical protein